MTSWNVIANEDFAQDKSTREKDLRQILTKCPLYDVNETVILAHETDCTKAYKCSWGKRYLLECPWIDDKKTEKLHFNVLKQYCDWPWNAGCIDCPGKEEDGYPSIRISYDTNSCSLYYQCVNGQKQLRGCINGCFSATCQDCVQNRTGGNCD